MIRIVQADLERLKLKPHTGDAHRPDRSRGESAERSIPQALRISVTYASSRLAPASIERRIETGVLLDQPVLKRRVVLEQGAARHRFTGGIL